MFYIIIALFAVAAIIGLIIFKNWLTSADTSKSVVYAHGIFAALALVLLLFFVLKNRTQTLELSLGLFAIAALGGFYMFFRDIKGKMSPMWVAGVHALLAVAGFVVLILYII